jgi:hypothetical protein
MSNQAYPNIYKIGWTSLSYNPNIFIIDYEYLKERLKNIKLEIINYINHPIKIEKWLEKGNTIEDFYEIYG